MQSSWPWGLMSRRIVFTADFGRCMWGCAFTELPAAVMVCLVLSPSCHGLAAASSLGVRAWRLLLRGSEAMCER